MHAGLETPLHELLHQGALELGLTLSSIQEAQLLRFLELLAKWNGTYNLTAVREPSRMLTHHILDCLSIVPLVERLGCETVLDVGTGAGLPGVVLGIALPRLCLTLVDAVQKKTAFLLQAKAELALPIQVIHARVEALTSGPKYDCIVSRAFSSLEHFIVSAGPLLRPRGALVAMKSSPTDAELGAILPPWAVREVVELRVPYLQAARCAVVMSADNTRSGSFLPLET